MKFGMPTLIELHTLDEQVALCRRLGLDFIELNMNMPLFQIPELRRLPEYRALEFTLHLSEDLNVWDFNERVKHAYLETVKDTIAVAHEKGIRLLNMHMNLGVYFTLPNERVYLFERYRDVFLEDTRRFIDSIGDLLLRSGVVLCVENTGLYGRPFITDALGILMQHPNLRLTWDIGHDIEVGQADTPFLTENIDRLYHVHLHDGVKGSSHLPLGTGELDVERFLLTVREHAERAVVETKTVVSLEESIGYLRTRRLIA